jgi:putative transposase
MLSWHHQDRAISIWTTRGRLKDVAFTGHPKHLDLIATTPIGESDLLHRDGMWFLHVTVRLAEPQPFEPDGFLGVDLGITNIATDSDGTHHSGARLNAYRRHQKRLRERLQTKHTKSAKRLLRKRRRKEARHTRNVNHVIAKRLVATAERTGRGIAVEDLTGIRERVRFPGPQRATMSSWAFQQLAQILEYKTRLAGIVLVAVDPRYTSQTCSHCGYRHRRNRPNQATFKCGSCGVVAHADHNAARNIAQRAAAGWVAVNLLNVA